MYDVPFNWFLTFRPADKTFSYTYLPCLQINILIKNTDLEHGFLFKIDGQNTITIQVCFANLIVLLTDD
jgi:hypothetical protein